MRRPVIIDCDPGVDDAVALFMALAADNLEVRAITSVAGNVSIDKTTKNALKLVEYAGRNVKVARGASRPISKEPITAEHVHGVSGLGKMVIPEPQNEIYHKNACDTIYEEALLLGGELEIIALGPLTNLAMTLMKYPDIKNKIKQVTIMGGSAGMGNDTPAAEFNICADPEAAKILFESGIAITMVGLDATNKAMIMEEELQEILSYNNKPAEFTAKSMLNFLDFCRSYGFEGAVLHDPAAVAAAIDGSLIKTRHLHVDVETKGEFTKGKTVVDIYMVTGKEPNIHVALDIDRERFINLVKGLMKKYEG